MKTFRLFSYSLLLVVLVLSLASCSTDSDDNDARRIALVTVYPQSAGNFLMQLDDSTMLEPTNVKTSPFGNKTVRALVSYCDDGDAAAKMRKVSIYRMDSIRTKMPVPTTGADDATAYGDDPIEIVRDWVTVAEDGFLTLRLRTIWGNGKPHVINLVSGRNKDNVYELTLCHDAQGDTAGQMGDAMIAFNLNQLWQNPGNDVKIKLNWKSFSGEKSTEFSMKMHKPLMYK